MVSFDDDQKKCGGISLFGFITILVSIAMIVIGSLNLTLNRNHDVISKCSAEPQIPYYLIIGGILTITLLFTRLIIQRCCRRCGQCGENDKICNTLCCAFKFSCISFYDLLALIATLIWLIIGTKWVFSVRDSVQHKNDNLNTFCPELLYDFSFWLIVSGWIFVVLALTFGLLLKFCNCFWDILCCKPCKSADQNQEAV